MLQCRRVVLDGLAAAGYRTAVEKEGLLLPTSGFMLHQTEQCTVRRCTAFFNGSGITINSGIGGRTDQPGEGKGNLVEDCRAFANRLDGIVAYNPSARRDDPQLPVLPEPDLRGAVLRRAGGRRRLPHVRRPGVGQSRRRLLDQGRRAV